VFVGRLDDEHVQQDALRLLKVPVGAGYEPVIGSLGRRTTARRAERDVEPRQFIFADGTGGVERVRIDFSGPHLDGLRSALDTTPHQHQPDTRTDTPFAPESPTALPDPVAEIDMEDLDALADYPTEEVTP
jgi:hypothetical protein